MSVDQIERFYARNLPLTNGMAMNVHSFGGKLVCSLVARIAQFDCAVRKLLLEL